MPKITDLPTTATVDDDADVMPIVRGGVTDQVVLGKLLVGIGDGAVGAPSVSFKGDLNLGAYRIGADRMGMTAGGELSLEVANATIANLDTANPATVRYASRAYAHPIAGVNETAAFYVRTSYGAGEEMTNGVYLEIPNTQLDTYGAGLKVIHAGAGVAMDVSAVTADGRGFEVARFLYGGGANYISTLQKDQAAGTIDNPLYEGLFCAPGGPGQPTIPGNVLPGFGMFYANQASGRAFVARKYGDGFVADGVPMFVLYENDLSTIRWSVYNDGSTVVGAVDSTAGTQTRNSPIIRCSGTEWTGIASQAKGGYFQFAYDAPGNPAGGSGFRFYTGLLGFEDLAFIVRSTGLDFNAAKSITNCLSIGNYTGTLDIVNAGPNKLASFDPTIADGETSLWLQRDSAQGNIVLRVKLVAAAGVVASGKRFLCVDT